MPPLRTIQDLKRHLHYPKALVPEPVEGHYEFIDTEKDEVVFESE